MIGFIHVWSSGGRIPQNLSISSRRTLENIDRLLAFAREPVTRGADNRDGDDESDGGGFDFGTIACIWWRECLRCWCSLWEGAPGRVGRREK